MMREIVYRRYKKSLAEQIPMPDLILIDGGRGHLSAAKAQLRSLGIMNVPVAGIAKNPDKLYIHEKKDPVLLGKYSGALLLCQRVRDEAHRFAITYHRHLRAKKTKRSELDSIKGIGPKRKAELIKYFGSLDKVKTADISQLKKTAFINEKEAKAVYDHFRV
jgi:excinuclease ABC subunit C